MKADKQAIAAPTDDKAIVKANNMEGAAPNHDVEAEPVMRQVTTANGQVVFFPKMTNDEIEMVATRYIRVRECSWTVVCMDMIMNRNKIEVDVDNHTFWERRQIQFANRMYEFTFLSAGLVALGICVSPIFFYAWLALMWYICFLNCYTCYKVVSECWWPKQPAAVFPESADDGLVVEGDEDDKTQVLAQGRKDEVSSCGGGSGVAQEKKRVPLAQGEEEQQ
jgi:hypothetical protein